MSQGKNGEKFQHDEDLNAFFLKSPSNLELTFVKIADILGIHDYRTVKRYLNKHRERLVNHHAGIDEPELTNETTTKTSGYDQKITLDKEYPTLEEYCLKYHIPFDKLTSVKFVNHNNQAAWNAVCDLTKISEVHLNKYFDRLKEAISDNIIPVNLPKNLQSNDASYWFMFSDKHVGAKTNEKAMFGNHYDLDVFEQRMLASLDNYIEEASYRGRFDKVFICDLGDSLDGWNQKTTRNSSSHVLPQNANNRESFDAYVKVTIKFLETLISLNLANEYEFVSVTNDNHSSDFGYICNRSVEVYLNVKYPDVKTRILSKFIEHVTYGDHTVLLCHGKDDEHLKHGLPLNIDQKTELFINSYLDAHKLFGNVHFIKGDLHQASTNYTNRFRYRNVLSLYGSSDWSQTNFGPNLAGISTEIIYKTKNKVVQNEEYFQES